jgi:thymidylate synthase (FAD)
LDYNPTPIESPPQELPLQPEKQAVNSPDPEHVTRPASPELDRILGQRLDVLDDGFVRVVDYMGNDGSIVQAARVSYGKGTKSVSLDRGLIRYLMRHRHSTPFEMCEIKLHVRVPMDCWRQWIRHRTANVNEYSTRYSIAIDEAQKTDPGQWRLQSSDSKQGSAGNLDRRAGEALSRREAELLKTAREVYEERLSLGVAREQARKDLPLSTYTEAYWKIDLHNLFHFLSLRMDAHAQEEIRTYANTIGEQIVARWVPLAWEAFCDYRMGSMFLTRIDREIVAALGRNDATAALEVARQAGWLEPSEQGLKAHRERRECEQKLEGLGMSAPWIAGDKERG